MRLTPVASTVGGSLTPALSPAATLPGDLLVLAIVDGESDEFGGFSPALLDPAFPDYLWAGARFASDAGVSSFGVTYDSLGGLSFLYQGWVMVAYRGVRSVDGESLSAGHGVISPPANPYATPPVPIGVEQAAITIIGSTNGTVAGRPQADVTGSWTNDGSVQRGRQSASIYHTHSLSYPNAGLIPGGEFVVSGTSPTWSAMSFGVVLEPNLRRRVTRQYPRDSLGLAAAPRLYPPPRTGRLVGGHP